MTRAEVDAWATDAEVELICADGFDAAILGIGQRLNDYFVVYDRDKVIETLVARDGMTEDEAVEWFEFNIIGAWVARRRPFSMTAVA